MQEINRYDDLRIPTYAIPYLVNGDDSGMNEQDKKNTDGYMQQFYREAEENEGHVIFSILDYEKEQEAYFTARPAFGLPCDVIDCIVLIVR